jgi:SAM-dependent methyltransferase
MLLWPSQRETSVMGMPYPRAADIPGMAGQATGPGDWLYRIEQVSALFSALQELPRHHHALAERLPWPAATFDLVVSTTSFDHWTDQRAGLAECARVLAASRLPCPGRPVLGAAAAGSAGRTAGQGTHQMAGNSSADGSRTALTELAPPVRSHHPGSDGDEIAVAIQRMPIGDAASRDRFGRHDHLRSVNYAPARVSWHYRRGMRDPPRGARQGAWTWRAGAPRWNGRLPVMSTLGLVR